MTALIEGSDADVMCSILLDNTASLFVCIEGVHQNEGHVHIVFPIQVLPNRLDPELIIQKTR